MTDTLSTSAQLRDTQRALAVSQADLTRVERERDLARAELASARAELAQLRQPTPDNDTIGDHP
jgi:uncharacterized protein (DUF3084 family)